MGQLNGNLFGVYYMMQGLFIPLLFIVLAIALYLLGKMRAMSVCNGQIIDLHSKPSFHGSYLAIYALAPALTISLIWLFLKTYLSKLYVISQLGESFNAIPAAGQASFLRKARSLADGISFGEPSELLKQASLLFSDFYQAGNILILIISAILIILGSWFAYSKISQKLRARQFVERAILVMLISASVIAIITTIGIVLSLVFESYRFFEKVPFIDFLFGLNWSPQSAFEGAGELASNRNSEVFGAVPVFAGTLLITLIAISIAAPIGLMSAIYLSDYASRSIRAVAKPLLEILAGIPTVVYGFFAALTVAPFLRGSGENIGLVVSSESALAAGFVMGIMIIPFVSSLSDDVINSVPQSLRDGSLALGSTKSETIIKVVIPAALPGIVSALMLAISRAIGETMIVVMAAGLAAKLSMNPLDAVTTVTVQIVTLLVGDQEFDSAKTLAVFALGLVLFCVTLALNIIALKVIQKYREQYD